MAFVLHSAVGIAVACVCCAGSTIHDATSSDGKKLLRHEPSWASEAVSQESGGCKPWCAASPKAWSDKCKWRNCQGCGECNKAPNPDPCHADNDPPDVTVTFDIKGPNYVAMNPCEKKWLKSNLSEVVGKCMLRLLPLGKDTGFERSHIKINVSAGAPQATRVMAVIDSQHGIDGAIGGCMGADTVERALGKGSLFNLCVKDKMRSIPHGSPADEGNASGLPRFGNVSVSMATIGKVPPKPDAPADPFDAPPTPCVSVPRSAAAATAPAELNAASAISASPAAPIMPARQRAAAQSGGAQANAAAAAVKQRSPPAVGAH